MPTDGRVAVTCKRNCQPSTIGDLGLDKIGSGPPGRKELRMRQSRYHRSSQHMTQCAGSLDTLFFTSSFDTIPLLPRVMARNT